MRDRLPALLVAVLGFSLYACTAYPFPDWLDSPELITAAFRLGGFHPPGSPLAVIAGHLFSLWPFASPCVSMLWFSAGFAACALYVLCRCVQDLWHSLGPGQPVVGKILAFTATSAFALSPGLWSQAVRAEVYTLAFFLFMLALREFLAVALASDPGDHDRSVLRGAAFTGMGLAVHPLMALTVAPGVALLALFQSGRRLFSKPRLLAQSALGLALGALPLLFLPFMVSGPVDLRFGDPATLTGWFRVVLGLTFSHSFSSASSTLAGSGSQALLVMFTGLGVGLAVFSLLGIYPLARTSGRTALGLSLIAAAGVLTLALQRSVRLDNPDATGYALPAMAAGFLMAAGGLAVAARLLAGVRRRLAGIVAVIAAGLALATALPDPAAFDRSECNAGRSLAVSALEELPANTLVLAADFNLVFMFDYLIRVEGIRTDVEVLFLRDLDNRSLRMALAREDPGLEALLPGSGELNRPALLRVAARRPVAVDPGPHLDARRLAPLRPRGLLWELVSGNPPDEQGRVSRQVRFFRNASPPVCGNGRVDPRTAEVVAWHAYWQASTACQLGWPSLAERMLAVAWCASPGDGTIAALAETNGLALPPECPRSRAAPAPSAGGPRPRAARAGMILLGMAAWLIGMLGFERKKQLAWAGISLAGMLATAALLSLA